MLSEYEYAQAVMRAVGVKPLTWRVDAGALKGAHGTFGTREEAEQRVADQTECSGRYGTPSVCAGDYPDPLSSGDAFLALWDALVAKGYVVRITVYPTRMTCVRMFSHVEDTFTAGEADDADRRVALVEAAGQALGVSRAT